MRVTMWLIYTLYTTYTIWRLGKINTFKYGWGKYVHIVTGLNSFLFGHKFELKNYEPQELKANHRTFHLSSILPFSGTSSDEAARVASCTQWMVLFTWPTVASCFCRNYNRTELPFLPFPTVPNGSPTQKTSILQRESLFKVFSQGEASIFN